MSPPLNYPTPLRSLDVLFLNVDPFFFVPQDQDVRTREDGEGLRHVVVVKLESWPASRIRPSSPRKCFSPNLGTVVGSPAF